MTAASMSRCVLFSNGALISPHFMRCRSLTVLEHWAVHESPILPFLAPSVFAPWLPSPSRTKPIWSSNFVRRGPPNPTAHRRSAPYKFVQDGVTVSSLRQCRGLQIGCGSQVRPSKRPSKAVRHPAACRQLHTNKAAYFFDRHVASHIHDQAGLSTEERRTSPGAVADERREDKEATQIAKHIAPLQRSDDDAHPVTKRNRYEPLEVSMLRDQDSRRREHIQRLASPWDIRIAMLRAKYDHRLSESKDLADPLSRSEVRIPRVIKGRLLGSWKKIRPRFRTRRWRFIMLYYLETRPTKALKFLTATVGRSRLPPYQVADVLDLVAAEMRRFPQSYHGDEQRDFRDTVALMVLRYGKSQLPISQRTLRLLSQHFPETVMELGGHVHYNTLLHVAQSLARKKSPEAALTALRIAVKKGADVSSGALLRVCSTMLRHSASGKGNYQDSSGLIASFFEMGIQMNLVMYNILILNASESRDPGTAWRIYDMILENGVIPDKYTYTIMMALCRRTHNKKAYQTLYRRLDPEHIGPDPLDPIVVTEVLACRYAFNLRSNFDHVLRFYEIHCDTHPLINLGILPPHYPSDRSKASPCAATLGSMIYAFLRSNAQHSNVEHIYERFKALLAQKDPCIVPLAATDHIYHSFLKALCSRHGTLPQWGDVVRNMITPLPSHIINRETGKPIEPLKATAQTWSIVVNALARDGQDEAALELITVMKKNGMEPTIVTWNSMLTGLAKHDKTYSVAGVLHRMEKAGIAPDLRTRESLLHLGDHGRLVAALAALKTGRRPSPNRRIDGVIRTIGTDDGRLQNLVNFLNGNSNVTFNVPKHIGRRALARYFHRLRRSKVQAWKSGKGGMIRYCFERGSCSGAPMNRIERNRRALPTLVQGLRSKARNAEGGPSLGQCSSSITLGNRLTSEKLPRRRIYAGRRGSKVRYLGPGDGGSLLRHSTSISTDGKKPVSAKLHGMRIHPSRRLSKAPGSVLRRRMSCRRKSTKSS